MNKYRIRDQYGTKLNYRPRSYDMACRVAHFVRKLGGFDVYVVDSNTGRATSEVTDINTHKDSYAKTVATGLLAGDYESKLI